MTVKKAASKEQVAELHNLICSVFKDQLQAMRDGDMPVDYKLLAAAAKFTNDNGVQAWEDIAELQSIVAQIAQRKQEQRENMPDNLVRLKERLATLRTGT